MDPDMRRLREALIKADVSELMVDRLMRRWFSSCQAGCEAGCDQCCETGTANRFAAANPV